MRSVLGVTTGREEAREAVGKANVEAVGDGVGGDQILMLPTDHKGSPCTGYALDT